MINNSKKTAKILLGFLTIFIIFFGFFHQIKLWEKLDPFIADYLNKKVIAYNQEIEGIGDNKNLTLEEKIQQYKDFIRKNPATHERNRLAYSKALAYQKLIEIYTVKNFPDLENFAEELLELQPDSYFNYLIVGEYFLSAQNYQKASTYLKTAFQYAPHNYRIYKNLVTSLSNLPEEEGNLEAVKNIFSSIPKSDFIQIFFTNFSEFNENNSFIQEDSIIKNYRYFDAQPFKVEVELNENENWNEQKTIKSFRIDPVNKSFARFKILDFSFQKDNQEVFKIDNLNDWFFSQGAEYIDKNSYYSKDEDPYMWTNNFVLDPKSVDRLVIELVIQFNE